MSTRAALKEAAKVKASPAMTGASKTVPKGQSSRVTKARGAQQRVAANKAAVDAINDERAKPTRVELVKQAQALGVKGASTMKVADLEAAIRKAEKATPAIPKASGPKAETDLGKRTSEALKEQKALKAWEVGGRKGPRPATPNFDEIRAEYADPSLKAKNAREKRAGSKKSGGGGGGTRSQRGPRGKEAMAAKAKKETRGKGKKLTPVELDAYIRGVQKAHPTSSASDEMAYAYWVEGLSVSRGTFIPTFDAIKAGAKPPKPEATVTDIASKAKAEPAKKAPAKKAVPSKKATGSTPRRANGTIAPKAKAS